MLRLLHFSDVHLTAAPFGWKLRDTFSKRLVGYTNLNLFGRAKRFRRSGRIVDAMIAEAKRRNYDAMLFSGDATMLAFESEFEHAARRLGVTDPALPPAIAVPGNHDYYTRRAAAAGYFEKHFAPWQQGIRIGDSPYPFARKIGHAWIIGLNSSYHPFFNWNASGVVGRPQLERLKQLCAQLDPGPRILVTHYPLRTAKGKIEIRSHRLLDQFAALTAAVECRISLWLHGHIHAPFVLQPTPGIPFPVICAGSCTQTHRMVHNEYELEGFTLKMQRRVFDLETGGFRDAETFHFELR
jgi:3',5'-cyclic AMP phosphodiesterase CpdA